jgi:hypothetical protein
MPTFKTPPDLDSSSRSPYDDLNRLEREKDRTQDRNSDRNAERNAARQVDRADDRAADLRAQDRMEHELDRNGKKADRDPERSLNREPDREPERAPAKTVQQPVRQSADGTDPLIQGLFSKLPEPSTEWPLAARQKWLQTAANIFDLMYAPGEADAGEVVIRVERTSAR